MLDLAAHRKGPPSPHGRVGPVCPMLTPDQIARGLERGRFRIEEGFLEKRCSCCGDFYPLDTEFWYFAPAGQYGTHNLCKGCYLEYRRHWRARRQQQTLTNDAQEQAP